MMMESDERQKTLIKTIRALERIMRWATYPENRIDTYQLKHCMSGYIWRHTQYGYDSLSRKYTDYFKLMSDMYKYATRDEQTLLNTIMCDLHGHPRRKWYTDEYRNNDDTPKSLYRIDTSRGPCYFSMYDDEDYVSDFVKNRDYKITQNVLVHHRDNVCKHGSHSGMYECDNFHNWNYTSDNFMYIRTSSSGHSPEYRIYPVDLSDVNEQTNYKKFQQILVCPNCK